MKYYAVIDTNVLVSAMLKWNSVPGSVLGLTFSGTIVPLWNEQMLTEYREVLMRPKFHRTQEIVDGAVNEIERRRGERVAGGACGGTKSIKKEDPRAAGAGRAGIFITISPGPPAGG